MTTALSKVMDWYEATAEMQFLAQRQLLLRGSILSPNSKFIDLSHQEIFEKMKQIKMELDDLAIVSLVSVFELLVLEYVTQMISFSKENETLTAFEENWIRYAKNQVERGRFTDILDLFKGTIDSQLVGNVKKAYQYRN